jgi:hypothetical protein
VFENRVLKRIPGHEKDEANQARKDCIMRRFIICTPPKYY